MIGLSDQSVLVIEALLQGVIAWQSPAELARGLGWTLDETNDVLCDLDTTGWIEVWDTDTGVFVTLSPRAASEWNATIIEIGPTKSPQWQRGSQPRPIASEFVDPSGCRPNSNATWRGSPKMPTPQPSTLIGLSPTPWPGPATPKICPACGSRRLGLPMYCINCDRWGHDPEASAPIPPSQAARPKPVDRNEPARRFSDPAEDAETQATRKANHPRLKQEGTERGARKPLRRPFDRPFSRRNRPIQESL